MQPAESPTPLTLIASDGFRLGALQYDARAPLAGNLIVAGATGVPQRFYRRFAEYASSNGFSTLTFDYRGIGLSRPPSLKGFVMDYLDWAQLDLAAAVGSMSGSATPLWANALDWFREHRTPQLEARSS